MYRIVANEDDITTIIQQRFQSLRITDDLGFESDLLELALADHIPAYPIAIPPTGAELQVYLGYDNDLQLMGLYVVDEVELSGWPGQMTIRGRAAPYDATSKGGKTSLQSQKSRSWEKGLQLGNVVRTIAREHGMEAAISTSLDSIVLPHFDQTEESDLSFLVRLSKRYDAIAKPGGGKIIFAKRGEGKTASGQDLEPVTLKATQSTNYSVTIAKKDAPGTVIAYWHSKKNARRIPITLGKGEPTRRLRHWYPDEEAARAGAQAELDKRARGEHKVTITTPGDTRFQAEGLIDLAGFREGVAGQWLITRVEHSLSDAGYVCALEAEKPNQDSESDDDDPDQP